MTSPLRPNASKCTVFNAKAQARKEIYSVDVMDFDNDVHTFEIEATSEQEASNKAVALAEQDGIQASYTCVYKY